MKRLPKVATEMALHVLAYMMGVDDRQKLQAMQLAGDAIQLVQFYHPPAKRFPVRGIDVRAARCLSADHPGKLQHQEPQ
jgi:diphthamide synthase (EF-2-diphthine--ammonia ligase)